VEQDVCFVTNKTLLREHLYHRDRNYDLFQCTSASSSTKTK